MAAQPLLKVENLVKHFHVRLGAFGERSATVYALDNVDLDIMLLGRTSSSAAEGGAASWANCLIRISFLSSCRIRNCAPDEYNPPAR